MQRLSETKATFLVGNEDVFIKCENDHLRWLMSVSWTKFHCYLHSDIINLTGNKLGQLWVNEMKYLSVEVS